MNIAKAFALYAKSFCGSLSYRDLFDGVTTYCMFIGYPRSSHSLIGSLLDAHPNMIVAHELDALKFVDLGFGKNQIFYLLLQNSREFAQSGRRWSGYSYQVSNQWQGRFSQLQVIGDKKGESSTLRIQKNPHLVKRLQDTVGLRLKFIHVLRNPFDNITTMTLKSRNRTLENRIDFYFSLCDTVANLRKQIGTEDIFDLRHESFTDDPKKGLSDLCRFLDVESTQDYLDDCARIVFKTPHRTRDSLLWTPELITSVEKQIAAVSFLQGYSFAGE